MTPFIAKLIDRGCVTTHANCPLDDLIAILAKRRIGTVVVVDRDQQVIGIVSERDIIRHLSTGGTTADTFAQNIMTNKVITVENNVTSAQLMKLIPSITSGMCQSPVMASLLALCRLAMSSKGF